MPDETTNEPRLPIFLVGGSDRHRRKLGEELDRVGFNVTQLATGEGVLTRLMHMCPLMFVIFAPLPVLNIIGLTRWIRATTGYEETPIIALVGSAADERNALMAEPTHVLRIPMFGMGGLARDIRTRLDIELALRMARGNRLHPSMGVWTAERRSVRPPPPPP